MIVVARTSSFLQLLQSVSALNCTYAACQLVQHTIMSSSGCISSCKKAAMTCSIISGQALTVISVNPSATHILKRGLTSIAFDRCQMHIRAVGIDIVDPLCMLCCAYTLKILYCTSIPFVYMRCLVPCVPCHLCSEQVQLLKGDGKQGPA